MANRELLLRAAKLLFQEGHTRQEIARILHDEDLLDNANDKQVRKILRKAGNWLINEHQELADLKAKHNEEAQLAEEVRHKFGLKAVRVVPVDGPDINDAAYADLVKKWGRAAAGFIDDLELTSEEDIHLAVSNGETVLEALSALPERRRDIHFYSASVFGRGRMIQTSHVGPEANATIGWARSGRLAGNLHYATAAAPDFTPRKSATPKQQHEDAREFLLALVQNQKETKPGMPMTPIMRVMHDVTHSVMVALLGLGVLEPAKKQPSDQIVRLTMTGLLEPYGISPELLSKEGVIGDVAGCLFNGLGRDKPEWRFFFTPGIGTDLEGIAFWKNLVENDGTVIVIAGIRKHAALIPALRARLLNVLITDSSTAQMLLSLKLRRS